MADFLLVVVLVNWGICALTGAVMAASRGHSGVLGFISGLIFGIFGLAMIAAMQRQPLSDETRCDACAEIVKSRAKICPRCRTERPAVAASGIHA